MVEQVRRLKKTEEEKNERCLTDRLLTADDDRDGNMNCSDDTAVFTQCVRSLICCHCLFVMYPAFW